MQLSTKKKTRHGRELTKNSKGAALLEKDAGMEREQRTFFASGSRWGTRPWHPPGQR